MNTTATSRLSSAVFASIAAMVMTMAAVAPATANAGVLVSAATR